MLNIGWRKNVLFLVIVSLLSVSVAEAKPGNGNGKPGGGGEDPPTVTSCDAPGSSAFPAFALNQVKYNNKGIRSGYDILLSNKDGDCTVKLASVSGDNSDQIDPNLRVSGSSGMFIWRQATDNTAKGKLPKRFDVIRAISFQVNNKEVSSIGSIQTLANSGASNVEYMSIDLSSDGSTLLVASPQPNSSGTSLFVDILEMDISNCSSNCSMTSIYSESPDLLLFDAKYNESGNRIYFVGNYKNNSNNGSLAAVGYISFIEKQNDFWSAPRHVALENNGFFGNDYSYTYPFKHLNAATTDLGSGPTEAITYTYYDPEINQFEVQVIDVGNCSISGSGDCLSMGEASIKATIANATRASLSSDSVRFTSDSSSDLFEYNFISQELSAIGSGDETADAK